MLFVAGEAGIRKTRSLARPPRRAQSSGFTVVRAAAFPDDMQSVAGLLLDLASSLSSAQEPALNDVGRILASRARALPAVSGDATRRRRLLVQDLCDPIAGAVDGPPVPIILEDLHSA